MSDIQGAAMSPKGPKSDIAYRAYSPSRNRQAFVTGDQGAVRGRVGALNQACVTNDLTPDWIVQSGTVEWHE